MKNRVKVVIGGESYTIVSEDEESYILQTAAGVDERMHAFLEASPVSALQAAVLTAMNYADDCKKAEDAADNMRAQMKSYLEDASRLRAELNDLRREMARLKSGK